MICLIGRSGAGHTLGRGLLEGWSGAAVRRQMASSVSSSAVRLRVSVIRRDRCWWCRRAARRRCGADGARSAIEDPRSHLALEHPAQLPPRPLLQHLGRPDAAQEPLPRPAAHRSHRGLRRSAPRRHHRPHRRPTAARQGRRGPAPGGIRHRHRQGRPDPLTRKAPGGTARPRPQAPRHRRTSKQVQRKPISTRQPPARRSPPAGTAHAVRASTATRACRTPRGSRGSGTSASRSRKPGIPGSPWVRHQVARRVGQKAGGTGATNRTSGNYTEAPHRSRGDYLPVPLR